MQIITLAKPMGLYITLSQKNLYKNRLGYGKGYYDRFLSDKELLQLRSIAVGYRCQAVEELPVEEHDIRPYQVILV